MVTELLSYLITHTAPYVELHCLFSTTVLSRLVNRFPFKRFRTYVLVVFVKHLVLGSLYDRFKLELIQSVLLSSHWVSWPRRRADYLDGLVDDVLYVGLTRTGVGSSSGPQDRLRAGHHCCRSST